MFVLPSFAVFAAPQGYFRNIYFHYAEDAPPAGAGVPHAGATATLLTPPAATPLPNATDSEALSGEGFNQASPITLVLSL